jgi:1-acyl-sn-glycerol-3-phosphate acyltransferase
MLSLTSLARSRAQHMSFRYRLLRSVFGFLLRATCRLHIEGIEHLSARRPLIVVMNHLHVADIAVGFTLMPGRSTIVVAEKWSRQVLTNLLFRFSGAVFINRGTADLKALREVQRRLDRGDLIAIAPEGTRSLTGGLQQGKGGAALLASKSGATIVPVAMWGQECVFKELRRLRRCDIYVRIGEAFTLPPLTGKNKSRQLDALTTDLMLHIARMLPPQYQGVYRSLVSEGASSDESRVSQPELRG